MCLFSVKPLIVGISLCATVRTYTMYTTIIIRSLFLSVYHLFASPTYTLFFSHDYSLFCLQPFRYTVTMMIFKNATCLHTWLTKLPLTRGPLCILFYIRSPHNIIKVEISSFRLLENSIATACICSFSYLNISHACCCQLIRQVFDVFVVCAFCAHIASCCVIVIYLFRVHDLCFCSLCLLFLMLNEIKLFSFL